MPSDFIPPDAFELAAGRDAPARPILRGDQLWGCVAECSKSNAVLAPRTISPTRQVRPDVRGTAHPWRSCQKGYCGARAITTPPPQTPSKYPAQTSADRSKRFRDSCTNPNRSRPFGTCGSHRTARRASDRVRRSY